MKISYRILVKIQCFYKCLDFYKNATKHSLKKQRQLFEASMQDNLRWIIDSFFIKTFAVKKRKCVTHKKY